MSDFNSSLPVRTENDGDLAIKVVDATVTSQQLKVNADGSIDANIVSGVTISSEVEVKNDSGNPIPISAASLPLPAGAATEAEQITQSASLASIDSKLTSPLTVQSTNLDIRDLVFSTDKVDVSGSAVTVSATALDIRAISQVTDSISIGDGTDLLAVNADGSINAKLVETAGLADYNTASAVAVNGPSSHTYTSTGNFYLTGVVASASGKMRVEIKVNGVTKAMLFNSTSNPNVVLELEKPLLVTSTQTVVVIRTNKDGSAQDLYSTVLGYLA